MGESISSQIVECEFGHTGNIRSCGILARPRAHKLGAHHKAADSCGKVWSQARSFRTERISNFAICRNYNFILFVRYVSNNRKTTLNTPPPHILLPHYIFLFVFLFLEKYNPINIWGGMPHVEADPPPPNPHFLTFGALQLRLRTTCFASVQFCHILHTPPLRGLCAWGVRLLQAPDGAQDHEVAL